MARLWVTCSAAGGEIPRMTRIKVCGITRPEDARLAVACGADAIGVILVPETPRYVGDRPDLIREIIRAAGPFVPVIAVVRALSHMSPFDAMPFGGVQYYDDDLGDHWPGRARIRVVRVGAPRGKDGDFGADDAVLLDSYDPNRLGGAGCTFDWHRGASLAKAIGLPVIVAGGLNPENVGNAVRAMRPYAVDVSSGVESAPRIKSMEKLREFVAAVRQADTGLECEC